MKFNLSKSHKQKRQLQICVDLIVITKQLGDKGEAKREMGVLCVHAVFCKEFSRNLFFRFLLGLMLEKYTTLFTQICAVTNIYF